MPEVPMEDILAAVQEGRMTAGAACAFLEARLAEAGRARPVRAASPDDAGAGDEYARLFPPHDPLGPDTEARDRARAAAARRPPPKLEDLADEDLHELLFGRTEFGGGG